MRSPHPTPDLMGSSTLLMGLSLKLSENGSTVRYSLHHHNGCKLGLYLGLDCIEYNLQYNCRKLPTSAILEVFPDPPLFCSPRYSRFFRLPSQSAALFEVWLCMGYMCEVKNSAGSDSFRLHTAAQGMVRRAGLQGHARPGLMHESHIAVPKPGDWARQPGGGRMASERPPLGQPPAPSQMPVPQFRPTHVRRRCA